jgi:peptidoglycan hydrolase-like protein with peptidoglycan-binding domain
MRWRGVVAAALLGVLVAGSGAALAAEPAPPPDVVAATPALIREIQFMLTRLGMEPGPIDGIAGPQTTTAVHKFQHKSGLPVEDLVTDQTISGKLVAQLRIEASRVILGNEPKPGPPPAASLAPVPPPAPPPDRFAACPFDRADFHIGGVQYTPDKFLQDGFDGSTARAIANLKDRLDEARRLAENIGGSALAEVQRQARVLGYFTCRAKIEQASDIKK